jgi:hypothetical protein
MDRRSSFAWMAPESLFLSDQSEPLLDKEKPRRLGRVFQFTALDAAGIAPPRGQGKWSSTQVKRTLAALKDAQGP